MKQIYLKRYATVAMLVLSVFFSLGYAQGDPVKGKSLFNANCAACHKLDKKMTGPPLAGVADRHDKEWLYKWVKNSSKLIKSGDKEAVAIWEEFNKAAMTPFPQLSNEDIDNIIAYTSAPPPKPKVAASASGENKEVAANDGVSYEVLMIILLLIFLFFVSQMRRVNKKLVALAQKSGIEGVERPVKSILQSYKENKFLKIVTVIVLFLSVLYFVYGYLMQVGVDQGYQPIQPIHFSHKIHAGDNKIECKYCHSNARVSKQSGVPALNVCMNCHKNISEYNGTENPKEGHTKKFYDGEIQKLYKAVGWDSDNQQYTGVTKPVKWVRIHNLPDFVYFNHSQHVIVAGVECQKCHGPVQEMEVLEQYAPLTMGWCINCHRKTNVDLKGNDYYKKIHEEFAKKYNKKNLTIADMGGLECGKCHY